MKQGKKKKKGDHILIKKGSSGILTPLLVTSKDLAHYYLLAQKTVLTLKN